MNATARAVWQEMPPRVDLCGTVYPADARPLPELRRSWRNRVLNPERFRFAGCHEGVPLVEVRMAWWHPVTWWRLAAGLVSPE